MQDASYCIIYSLIMALLDLLGFKFLLGIYDMISTHINCFLFCPSGGSEIHPKDLKHRMYQHCE